jgi:transposase
VIKAHKIRLHPTPEQANYFARAADQPFLDLGQAFPACFEGQARRPKFTSKNRCKPSFYLANAQVELGDHRIWVPKLGWVNLAEQLRFEGKVTGARITTTAHWWCVSIQVELPDEIPVNKPAAVGIDVGLNRLATLSTAEGVENQAFLKTALKSLRQANKRLARSFSDASPGTLVRLLEAKVAQRGGQAIKVDRFFPSRKTCHCCGWKWDLMTLKDRVFVCQNPACPYDQFPQDRDHNAGQNVLREALRLIGLIDQVVCVTSSDEDGNWASDAG